MRIQLHEVRSPMPEEATVADQVVHLVRFTGAGAQAQVVHGELHPARLPVVRVQVDDDDDQVRQIRR